MMFESTTWILPLISRPSSLVEQKVSQIRAVGIVPFPAISKNEYPSRRHILSFYRKDGFREWCASLRHCWTLILAINSEQKYSCTTWVVLAWKYSFAAASGVCCRLEKQVFPRKLVCGCTSPSIIRFVWLSEWYLILQCLFHRSELGEGCLTRSGIQSNPASSRP